MDDEDVTTATETVTLTNNNSGNFYHMGTWIDLNGDGRKDFLTASSNAKENGGKLVWLEHPEGGLDQTPWEEHVIYAGGPDVGIEVDYLDEFPGEIVVFAAEFFNEELAFYRVSIKDGSFVERRVIDDSAILSAYSVALEDINNDGKKELIVNNHEKDSSTNGIWAYTVPIGNMMEGDFEKFTIASGFKNAFNLLVPGMSPGFPYAVWPEISRKGIDVAHVMVAGDGDYSFHDFYSTGDVKEFQYSDDLVKNEKGTVGALDFADLDNDGWLEVYVPNYDKGFIQVYKTGKATTTVEEI